MADLSEYRGILVIGTVLTVFALLVGTIPPEFYASPPVYVSIDIPEYFHAYELQSYYYLWNSTYTDSFLERLDDGDGVAPIDFGGHFIDNTAFFAGDYIRFDYMEPWLFFFEEFTDFFQFYDSHGIPVGDPDVFGRFLLHADALNATYQEFGSVMYRMKALEKQVSFDAYFSFNETTYDDPVDAWDDEELHVMCGMAFDQTQTSYNAWDLLSNLLTFQRPDITGLPFVLNVIIAVPFWIGMAYIIVKMIQSFLPFVGGG